MEDNTLERTATVLFQNRLGQKTRVKENDLTLWSLKFEGSGLTCNISREKTQDNWRMEKYKVNKQLMFQS